MGQRANLILLQNRQYRIYYTHWRANTLDRDLFWGPDHATLFARVQKPTDDWLDEVWAEGGAVIDHDARVLLFYGGEDLLYEIPLRRAYLRALARAWDGWDVRWAYEGIADLADYVGHPRAGVLDPRPRERQSPLRFQDVPGWVVLAVSLLDDCGRLRFYTTHDDATDLLRAGPGVLAQLATAPHHDRLDLAQFDADFPNNGVHLDPTGRTLDFWLAHPSEEIAPRTAAAWPGWSVTWHRDRYESQLERCRGLLTFPVQDEEKLRARLRESLLLEEKRTGVDVLLNTMEALAKRGEEVTDVNLHATRDAHLTLSAEDRRRILDHAFAR
jgi:hypothetical protein